MTPTPAEQRDLYLWLKGDPLALRAVKVCPSCSNGIEYHTGMSPCPTCSGHGVVFREDDEGRRLILKAYSDWWYNGSAHLPVGAEVRAASRESGTPLCYEEFAWDNRHGQPWQPPLEEHVRKWEAPVPDLLAGDTMEQLLREAKIDVQLHLEYDGECHAVLFRKGDVIGRSEYRESRQAALYAAAMAAKGDA